MNIDRQLQSAFEYFQEGNLEQAERICQDILDRQHDEASALHLLGVITYQQGKYDLAVEYINKSIEAAPDNASAYFNLGTVLRENGQLGKAIDSYRKSLSIDPSNAAAYNNLGIALKEKDETDEAISCYQKAIELNKDLIPAYYNLGTLLREKGRFDEAVSYYRRALELNDHNAAIHNSLGLVLREKGLLVEALQHYQKAIEYDPENAAYHSNLGIITKEMGQLDKAIVHLEKSFEIYPTDTALDQIFEISEIILRQGDLNKGWTLYWKLNDPYWRSRIPNKPMWEGSDISGLTLLIQSDAGRGDTIQYIRYAPLIAQSGAKIILTCPGESIPLFRDMNCVEQVMTSAHLSQFDTYTPIRRLPLVMGTTIGSIPANVPYLSAKPLLIEKWSDRILPDKSRMNVGLVWASGHDDSVRSCRLGAFLPITQIPDITCYSLQIGGDKEARTEELGVIDYTKDIHDFADTAAFIENLDLIITVDTAVAHLSGALGKPVWTLLPFVADSRWLSDREDSPWYPTMRLIRRPSPGDWESVVSRVKEELIKYSA